MATMMPPSSFTFPPSPPPPHKKRRLSKSPKRYYPPSYSSYQSPSLSTLAEDRHASRQKLQSTWEDIIQKYSILASDEADEIDLDTGEIIIDHGHLKSLHDSTLWDPQDSERESENDETSDVEIIERFPGPSAAVVKQSPKKAVKVDVNLPSEEEIIERFGEQYGRDILSYLKQRNSTQSSTSNKTHLWSGPEGEAEIFEQAKLRWKEWREKQATPMQTRQFDKDSFERAVFGAMSGSARTAFEEAVFGQALALDDADNEEEWADDDGATFDKTAAFEEAVFGQRLAFNDEEDIERKEQAETKGPAHAEGNVDFDALVFGKALAVDEDLKDSVVDAEGDDYNEVDGNNRSVNDEVVFSQPIRVDDQEPGDGPNDDDDLDIDDANVDETILLDELDADVNDSNNSTSLIPTTEVINLITPSPPPRPPQSRNTHSEHRRHRSSNPSPSKRVRTPSYQGLLPPVGRPSTHKKQKSRDNVVSGLIVDGSDEEDDFFDLTSSIRSFKRRPSTTPKSVTKPKIRENSTPHERNQDIIILDEDMDTNGRCGQKGYRCTKAFCFTCIP